MAKNLSSSLTSKGQVTVPQDVRNRLGVVVGDRIDFVPKDGEIVIRPSRNNPDHFSKQLGILGPFSGGEAGIKEWIDDMRSDED